MSAFVWLMNTSYYGGPFGATNQSTFHINSILVFLKSVFSTWKYFSFRQNIIFNHNRHFHFAETWFSTVNASFILNKLHFWLKMLFWFWKIAIFKQKMQLSFWANVTFKLQGNLQGPIFPKIPSIANCRFKITSDKNQAKTQWRIILILPLYFCMSHFEET